MSCIFIRFFTYFSLAFFLSSCSSIHTSSHSLDHTATEQFGTTCFVLDDIIFSGSDWRVNDLDHLQSVTINYFSNLFAKTKLLNAPKGSSFLVTVEWSKRLVVNKYHKSNTLAGTVISKRGNIPNYRRNSLLDTVLRRRGIINNVPQTMIGLTLRVQSQQIGKNSNEVRLRDLFSVLELNNERAEAALLLGISKLNKRMDLVTL